MKALKVKRFCISGWLGAALLALPLFFLRPLPARRPLKSPWCISR